MTLAKPEDFKAVIGKGKSRKEAYQNSIKDLDGLSTIIKNKDKIFIKCNLRLPNGFPTNTSFEMIKQVVSSCKAAGATEIYVGDVPYEGISLKKMDDLLGINSFLKEIGAKLAFLDNSQYFRSDELDQDQLTLKKHQTFEEINQGENTYLYPKAVLDCDKFILLNQVNVTPLFKIRYAIASTFSLISNDQQKIINPQTVDKEYLEEDEYKKELISKMIEVYSINPPDLVINDCFYLMEGAGPYIYQKSQLKKTDLMVVSSSALAADLILQHLCELDISEDHLLAECKERKLGPVDLSEIDLIGGISKLNDYKIDIDLPVTRTDLIHLKNLSIKEGLMCSGCKRSLYHLLNLIDSNMVKDLKYIGKNSLLAGQDPPNHDKHYSDNIIVFGDCAIKSTPEAEFREIRTQKEKISFLEFLKSKFKTDYEPKTTLKEKVKENENILEISGCPPRLADTVQGLIDYFGEKELPQLSLFNNMINLSVCEDKEQLKEWEKL
ncbi:MAG: DUF362 domain-containing protein [Promethearchaeia archaeon]